MEKNILFKVKKNKSSSKIVLLFLFAVMMGSFCYLKKWKAAETPGKIINWDVTSYYSYLPATFIYGDLTLEFLKKYPEKKFEEHHQFFYQIAPNGNRVCKFTMGMAILYSPFFFLAHGCAHLFNYTADGFSLPYEFFLNLSCLFYLSIGLLYLRKTLLLYYSDVISSFVLISIMLGTNLYYYSTTEPAMSHAYSFSLVAVFMYQFITWHCHPQLKRAVMLGVLFGLIVLVRPVNCIIILFPIFYDVFSKKSFLQKIDQYILLWKDLVTMAVSFIITVSPQLIYWKYMTGHFLFYSYQDEKFYFNHPHFIEGLFSFRNGWLIYTPIMIFAFIGFVILYKRKRQLFFASSIFTLINIFIAYCWWTWWYGGSFGSRPMIDTYALMAIPLAAFFEYLFERSKSIIISITSLVVLLISLNLFQTYQKSIGIIHWDSMTKEAYMEVFLKTKMSFEDCVKLDKALVHPNYEHAMKGME